MANKRIALALLCAMGTLGLASMALAQEAEPGEAAPSEAAPSELAPSEGTPHQATLAEAEFAKALHRGPRIITTATAWILPSGRLYTSVGLDQNVRPVGLASLGLGGVAEVGLSMQREWSLCEDCAGEPESVPLFVSSFKMGLPEGTFHRHQPAVSLVFRRSLADKVQVFTEAEHSLPVATLALVTSKDFGPVSLHLGAELFAADDPISGEILRKIVRPTVGLQWRPSAYPQTTLLADLRWQPRSVIDAAMGADFAAIWNAGWGVRYQALDWGAVDLNVRHQEGEAIGDAVVTIGLTGAFDLLGQSSSRRGVAQ